MFGDSFGDKPPDPGHIGFVPGPNPAPGLRTDATIDPNRVYAPFAQVKAWFFKQDRANPEVQRRPDQLELLPVKELPPAPVFVIAGGYETPFLQYQRGWEQAFVPEAGRRPALAAQTPVLQLSQPIKFDLAAAAVSQARRKNIKAKAPKAKE